jgi:hypothetical protein
MNIIKIIATGLILGIYSCCFSKTNCVETSADMIRTINFINFPQEKLDSIILTSYKLNSNFTSAIDNTIIHVYPYDTLKFTIKIKESRPYNSG